MALPSTEAAREWVVSRTRDRRPSRGRKGLAARLPVLSGPARTRGRPRRRARRRRGTGLLGTPRAAMRSMPKPPPLSMPKAPSLSMPSVPSLTVVKVRARRRRRARGAAGGLGMALGACAGYLLGTRAGRERYQQILEQARQFWQRPQVQDLATKGRDRLGMGVERAAGSAGDRLHQARERSELGPSSDGPGTTG